MYKINDNYLKLPGSYLFSTIAKKVNAYTAANPDKKVIRLGIGDVTLPLAPAVIDAMHKAVDEMAHAETFHGYAPDLGYEFLRSAIVENDYKARGVDIAIDEIFVSDGAKSDSGNIGDIFAQNNRIAVCDPVYPVYVDTNAMAGRTGDYVKEKEAWSNVIYMPCTAENNFVPELPKETPDNMTSWDFFDYLLENLNIVGTPGSGFGPSGEGYFRLTAFGSLENTKEAMERIVK